MHSDTPNTLREFHSAQQEFPSLGHLRPQHREISWVLSQPPSLTFHVPRFPELCLHVLPVHPLILTIPNHLFG